MLIATIPAIGLFVKFEEVQLAYAVVGAAFMPFLAAVLLFLNGSAVRIGRTLKNSKRTTIILAATVIFFAWAGFYEAREKIHKAQDSPKPERVSTAGRLY